jgi:hypothetical protein
VLICSSQRQRTHSERKTVHNRSRTMIFSSRFQHCLQLAAAAYIQSNSARAYERSLTCPWLLLRALRLCVNQRPGKKSERILAVDSLQLRLEAALSEKQAALASCWLCWHSLTQQVCSRRCFLKPTIHGARNRLLCWYVRCVHCLPALPKLHYNTLFCFCVSLSKLASSANC